MPSHDRGHGEQRTGHEGTDQQSTAEQRREPVPGQAAQPGLGDDLPAQRRVPGGGALVVTEGDRPDGCAAVRRAGGDAVQYPLLVRHQPRRRPARLGEVHGATGRVVARLSQLDEPAGREIQQGGRGSMLHSPPLIAEQADHGRRFGVGPEVLGRGPRRDRAVPGGDQRKPEDGEPEHDQAGAAPIELFGERHANLTWTASCATPAASKYSRRPCAPPSLATTFPGKLSRAVW